MKEIGRMSRDELMEYAKELGAHSGESIEESATRLEMEGEEQRAVILQRMAFRWWALEEVGVELGATPPSNFSRESRRL